METTSDYYALTLPVSTDQQLRHASPFLVDHRSPMEHLRAVETLAQYFKREMHFDQVQFDAGETPDSLGYVPYQAWFFHEPARDLLEEDEPLKLRIFGACCFRWREWTNAEPSWSLDWVWMHPYFRRRGHLAAAWPTFQARYGIRFDVAQPLSIEMEAFVQTMSLQGDQG
ncbi:hypothetical protein [Burkholderia sp. Ac-20365]|uniref:hypothetical protein n=1 Tax=Burkholderia sp. Ac-20365 TaxID=2703897 RepID=UPI00197C52BD|nr:hypothetical protein [Burkholderia sp. Ac-20365]MBN3761095.1 hypothetical protein [Burkholderia sp. Ac-20365]